MDLAGTLKKHFGYAQFRPLQRAAGRGFQTHADDAQDHDQSAGAARDVLAGFHRMRRKQSALHPLHRDDAGALSAPRPVLALRHPTNRAKDRGTRQREFGSARADRPSGGRSDALTPTKPDVRFGSKADMCSAPAHVRFTPESDIRSGS